ncbi:ferrochelatase [Sphingomicrobium astaxanthinifaciens]|uniref:ferrochelatase n=1 Tax=Sphingomicrobium astaxanthinifaciens TaxID=1227949 RepID=UPI001FCBA175|nr:ferrochelatase [Sphingomicrobium astaxanthinifaciens]MCJ7421446.1 ferrochelatase [Sphingomicrobium astaxanthinifaciens]
MDKPADHPTFPTPRVGVLLTNLGTPDAAEPKAVRRYLKQFLSDRRVIEIPPIAWQPILRGIILNTRPRKSAAAYKEVWTKDGSPLAAITKAQGGKLRERLGEGVLVDWAMRYGNPSIPAALDRLWEAGARKILFAPLYPQYCAATSASSMDALSDWLAQRRWQPAIRTLPPYYDDPVHLDALAADLKAQLAALDFAPQKLLLSFHGMPERTLHKGDPYHCQCQKTGRLLTERLELPTEVTFQSRFGPAQWLAPATDTRLEALPGEGVTRLAIAAPGFSADCLETIEELGIRGREQFLEAGGEQFARLDCLNDRETGMEMLETLIRQELGGWA